MKFTIHGDKVKVTEPIQQYIENKIGRLDKYLENPDDIHAKIAIRVRGIEQIVEVTIPVKKVILRGEETHKDLYAAIDLVSEKIERQIRKNKTRLNQTKSRETYVGMVVDFELQADEPQEVNKVVKRKNLEMKPMSEEEAILQMELLGHEFFIYKDSKTNEICVLYHRKDGNYGIIETH